VDALGEREALIGVADRGLEHLLELHRPEAVEQLGPAVDRSRHRGGVHPGVGDLGQPAAREVRPRPLRRRPAAGVEPVELFVAGHVTYAEDEDAKPDERNHHQHNGCERIQKPSQTQRVIAESEPGEILDGAESGQL